MLSKAGYGRWFSVRAGMSSTITSGEVADEADLEIGAANIARNIFGGRVTERQVYRMAHPQQGWPFFRVQGKLALRPSAARSEMARREAVQLGKPHPWHAERTGEA